MQHGTDNQYDQKRGMQCFVPKVGTASPPAWETANERQDMQDDLRNALVGAFGALLVEPIKEEGNDATTDDPRDIPIQIGDDDEEQHQQERNRSRNGSEIAVG